MKFVCRRCEAFMRFEEVEGVRQDSLGVTFLCPGCGARFSMVTNPGETQMVHALGVKLGGSAGPAEPLELTRSTLALGNGASGPASASRRAGEAVQGAAAAGVRPLPETGASASGAPSAPLAPESKGKCPFANMMAEITGASAGASAGAPDQGPAQPPPDGAPMEWTPEARERIGRVPDFIRDFARVLIERMARERGLARVDGALMDEAKSRFM